MAHDIAFTLMRITPRNSLYFEADALNLLVFGLENLSVKIGDTNAAIYFRTFYNAGT
jgi:hypothetical protein